MNKRRLLLFPAIFGLVALPMFAGFAGPDVSASRWDHLGRTALRLTHNLLSLPSASAADDSDAYASYSQALRLLKSEYYGEPITPKKSKELTYAAISGMLYTLNDPFTSFLDPDAWATMQQTTRGDFEGIGAELQQIGPDVRVVRPIPETPAFKAGVKAGDTIIGVDEYSGKRMVKAHPTHGMNINDVVKLIKGPRGTMVGISVMRKNVNKPLNFVITRAHIEPPIVRYWMEDNQYKIGHVLLNEFNEKSDDQLQHAIDALKAQGMKALVFDLRYNPGGLLSVAVDVGSRFVSDAPVVIIQEKNGQRQELPARSSEPKNTLPMVVLVNENSASASEIVAGAIKDNGAGTLVGEHTFGKGLVQTLFPLSDGSALRLTTAKYFTSKGNDISNKYDDEHRPIFGTGGIKPDMVVQQSPDWSDQDFDDKKDDTQLHAALDILRKELNKQASTKPAGK